MEFTDYDEFRKHVGILDAEDVKELGLTCDAGDGEFYGNYISAKKLLAFVKDNPDYHIVTMLDADGAIVYDNSYRQVNRLMYFLADGSKDEAYYVDSDEDYEDED